MKELSWPGGDSHIKLSGEVAALFREVNLWTGLLRVFLFKMTTLRTTVAPFRVF